MGGGKNWSKLGTSKGIRTHFRPYNYDHQPNKDTKLLVIKITKGQIIGCDC